jgi:DNA-binding NtrC family response regulator
MREAAGILGRPEMHLSRGALDLLMAHNWPGNVREFKNCIMRAMTFAEGDLILRRHVRLDQGALDLSHAQSAGFENFAASVADTEDPAAWNPASLRETGESFAVRGPMPPDLNERQFLVLARVREQGGLTRQDYENIVGEGISSRTAQNDLRDLVERGLLERVGGGPGTRYLPRQ